MAQIRSTYLHRIPYSMIWNNVIFDKNNPWDKIFNSIFSKNLLNSFLNYSSITSNKNWFWSDNFLTYNYFTKKNKTDIKFSSRLYYLNFLKKNMMLYNSNNNTNAAIQGKTNFFNFNNNLYCLNAYYLQSFSKIKNNKNKDKHLFSYKIKNNKYYSFNLNKYKNKYKQTKKFKNFITINETKLEFIKNILNLKLEKNHQTVSSFLNYKKKDENSFYMNLYTTYHINFYKYNLNHSKNIYNANKYYYFFNFITNYNNKLNDKLIYPKITITNNSKYSTKKNKKNLDKLQENKKNLDSLQENRKILDNSQENNEKTTETDNETLYSFLKCSLDNYFNKHNQEKPINENYKNELTELEKNNLIQILKENLSDTLKYILKEIIDENNTDILKEILSSNPNEVLYNALTNKHIPNFKLVLAEAIFENKEDNPFYELPEDITEKNMYVLNLQNKIDNNTNKIRNLDLIDDNIKNINDSSLPENLKNNEFNDFEDSKKKNDDDDEFNYNYVNYSFKNNKKNNTSLDYNLFNSDKGHNSNDNLYVYDSNYLNNKNTEFEDEEPKIKVKKSKSSKKK